MLRSKSNNNPGIRIITMFMIAVWSLSCSDTATSTKRDKEQKRSDTIPVSYKKPPSSFGDTLIITGESVVFYNPDSLQREKIKEITRKNVYESNEHDCFYLMRNARVVLKKYWRQIHIIETSKNRYLLFVKADKTRTCIDLNSKGDMCGIFLFDGKKEPELADMMNIETVLGFYFAK
ncbi:MAG TPA: hypothetical protein VK483_03705 [Chitinophagaceae bacterium]|nr:hypothetical protein [Chitinophagaceae bacterium]